MELVNGTRDLIINRATWWALENPYKPSPEELVFFFENARVEQAPTLAEAAKSLKTLGGGCYVGGQVKHWCGVFACSVARECGLTDIRWTLFGGKIVGSQVKKVWGNKGIQPGDIAVIAKLSHHFVVTDVNEELNKVSTVDGNQAMQTICMKTRDISSIVAYYRILD